MCIIAGLSSTLYAKSSSETIGDILAIGLPLSAYSTTLYLDDKEGEIEFYKNYATTMGTTLLLKYTVREERPDTKERDSFPSGHTSSAFSGASFIHMRYGFKYALIPYLAAIYTGYTRVESNRHHPIDVYAGAVLGMLSSWYFVSRYENVEIAPVIENDFKGLTVSYKW